jgi:hypothetical protein
MRLPRTYNNVTLFPFWKYQSFKPPLPFPKTEEFAYSKSPFESLSSGHWVYFEKKYMEQYYATVLLKIFSLRSRGVWSFPIAYFEKKYIENLMLLSC